MVECAHEGDVHSTQNCGCHCPRCLDPVRLVCICPICTHAYRTADPRSH